MWLNILKREKKRHWERKRQRMSWRVKGGKGEKAPLI